MLHGVFVSGTGTGVGKTWLCRGLARALVRAGHEAIALKPVETGVELNPADATRLGVASGRPELAHLPGFVRRRPPLSPYACELAGERSIDVDTIAGLVRGAAARGEAVVVESAGGLFVPLNRHQDTSHLALELTLPIFLVAPNRLGVLSDVLAYGTAAQARGLEVAALVLTDGPWTDASSAQNHRILLERLGHVVCMPCVHDDDDDALADAVEACGLLARTSRLVARSRERERPTHGGRGP